MIHATAVSFDAYSLSSAFIGIIHAFAIHFVIGGGFYLVLAEIRARRKNDAARLAYLERYSHVFALAALVFGVLTVIDCWISIGLTHPDFPTWRISGFVWGWAVAWILFLLEIAAAFAYYYGWKRLSPKAHIITGWGYLGISWLFLLVLNNVLVLTFAVGRYARDFRGHWDGFIDPTFWPSAFLHTFICLVLAGLFAAFIAAREKNPALKATLLRGNGWLVLGSLMLSIPCGFWFFTALPEGSLRFLMTDGTALTAVRVMLFSAGLLVLLTLLGTIIFPRRAGYVSGAILLLCALMSLGGLDQAWRAVWKHNIENYSLPENGFPASESAVPISFIPFAMPPVRDDADDTGHQEAIACASYYDWGGRGNSLSNSDLKTDSGWAPTSRPTSFPLASKKSVTGMLGPRLNS